MSRRINSPVGSANTAYLTTTVGRHGSGVGIVALAALVLGSGVVHLVVAVPQAVFPVVAGLVLLGEGVAAMPAGRRTLQRVTGVDVDARTVVAALGAATGLCVLYALVSFIVG